MCSSNPASDRFLARLHAQSKFKQRSHDTHSHVHLPELNTRLNLNLPAASSHAVETSEDVFSANPDSENMKDIRAVYIGNSMLERLKTTGRHTQLAALDTAFNAGCGGDTNENATYRLHQGLYAMLKSAQEEEDNKCEVQVWILASGTNNLHPKRGFRAADVESWKVLVEACLDIAPRSIVLACDVFYRKDIEDDLVDDGNNMLRKVIERLNAEDRKSTGDDEEPGEERVKWIEVRHLIDDNMLDDHVHLNERGYEMWDRVL